VYEEYTPPRSTLHSQNVPCAKGWKIEVKTEGDLTCSTATPPASPAQTGVNTTCSILRAGKVVAVEVTAPSQKEMASMDAARKLVEKAVTRL